MLRQLKKHIEISKILKKAKPQKRKLLLEAMENGLIYCLSECIDNVLRGAIKISSVRKRELEEHKGLLQKIVEQKTKVQKK